MGSAARVCSCVPPRSLKLYWASAQAVSSSDEVFPRDLAQHPARVCGAVGIALIDEELEPALLHAPSQQGEVDLEADPEGVAQAGLLEFGGQLAHSHDRAVGRGVEAVAAFARADHVLRHVEEGVEQLLVQSAQPIQKHQRNPVHHRLVSFALA